MTHVNINHALTPPRINHDGVHRAWKKFLRRHGYKSDISGLRPDENRFPDGSGNAISVVSSARSRPKQKGE